MATQLEGFVEHKIMGVSPEEIVRVMLKISHQRNIYILCAT